MRVVRGILAALILSAACVQPAAASGGCYGCNIVDTGDFGRHLIGRTMYIDRPGNVGGQIVIENVDTANGAVYAHFNDNYHEWVSARDVYSAAEMDERRGAYTAGTAAAIIGGLALLFGGAGGGGSSSGSSQQTCTTECVLFREDQYGNNRCVETRQSCY